MISSKYEGLVLLLGGKDGQVAQTLANVKKIEAAKKGPVTADIVTITAILTSIRNGAQYNFFSSQKIKSKITSF